MPDSPAAIAVLDASVLVDLLAGTSHAAPAKARLRGTVLHAPAHLDAEVLSALGRLPRAGELITADVETAMGALSNLPVTRHPAVELARGPGPGALISG